jgi:hypothetical protein
MSELAWRNAKIRAVLVAVLVAVGIAAIPGTAGATTYPSTPYVAYVPHPTIFNEPNIPSGWDVSCTIGFSYPYQSSTCPVLVWGDYTYWAYSPHDNSWSLDIVAYDPAGNIVKQVVVGGDRYVWDITVDDTNQTVTFHTQGYLAPNGLTVSWADLYVNPAVATTTSVDFGSGPFVYKGSAYTATATVLPDGSGSADIAYSGDCTDAGNTCSATASYAGDSGHLPSTSDPVGITIDPAPLTITASSGTMSYGDPVPAVTPQVDGLVGSDTFDALGAGLTCTTTATSNSDPGTYPTSCSGASDGNYDASYEDGSIAVSPATPTTPTISNPPTTAVYGGGFTAAVATNGDGTTSVTSSTPSVCSVADDGLTVSYDHAGTCTLVAHVAAGTDYLAGDGVPQTFTVAKADPALAWASPTGIVYGTPLGASQLDATASTPGTFTYSPSAGTVLGPGSRTLSATFTPADSADWNGGAVTTTISVGFSQACITGVHNGPITVSHGQALCIGPGASVHGPVRVTGGALWVDGASITGPVSTTGATAVGLCGSTVTGPLSIASSSGPVLAGDGAGCAGNRITGPVSIEGNAGGVSFAGNAVVGPATLRNNSGGFSYAGNTVNGPVRLQNNS